MLIEALQLTHQSLLNPYLNQLNLKISEYNFTNLYLFRQTHQYQVCFNEHLLIKGIDKQGYSFLMPLFSLMEVSHQLLKYWLTQVDYLFPIPEIWIPNLNLEEFDKSFSEGDSDYIFSVEKIFHYEGNHLKEQRNLIQHLLANYEVHSFPLTLDRLQHALQVLEIWQEGQSKVETDFFPCQEAIQRLNQLQLDGHIFYIQQQPCAFFIGEIGQAEQYIIHFAKAFKAFKGLYPYMYQYLAQTLIKKHSQVKWLNMQQDLGLPHLHKAKRSYEPDHLIHKWRISLRSTQ